MVTIEKMLRHCRGKSRRESLRFPNLLNTAMKNVLAGILAMFLVGIALHGVAKAQDSSAGSGPTATLSPLSAGIDLVTVPEEQPWAAAVAAPVAARLRTDGRPALLLVLSSPPTREAEGLLALAAPRHALVIAAAAGPKLGKTLPKAAPEVLVAGADPVGGSFLVAKRFWKQSRCAVVAAADDAEAVVLGASLAARLNLPLLLRERTEKRASLAKALQQLGVEEILAAVSDPKQPPAWTGGKQYGVQVLGPRALQSRTVEAIGADQIHTIVVARARRGAPRSGRRPGWPHTSP